MSLTYTPSEDDLRTLVEQVWETYVGPEPLLPAAPGLLAWSAAVRVDGAWSGTVSVSLSAAAANAITSRMLDAALVSTTEVADAVGELANMVGGNVKSLVDEPSTLSLPQVSAGPPAPPSGVTTTRHLDLTWCGEPVAVSLHLSDDRHLEEAPR